MPLASALVMVSDTSRSAFDNGGLRERAADADVDGGVLMMLLVLVAVDGGDRPPPPPATGRRRPMGSATGLQRSCLLCGLTYGLMLKEAVGWRLREVLSLPIRSFHTASSATGLM